jgi:hypothetical protein
VVALLPLEAGHRQPVLLALEVGHLLTFHESNVFDVLIGRLLVGLRGIKCQPCLAVWRGKAFALPTRIGRLQSPIPRHKRKDVAFVATTPFSHSRTARIEGYAYRSASIQAATLETAASIVLCRRHDLNELLAGKAVMAVMAAIPACISHGDHEHKEENG